jgi:AbrB family looped-hinge helix DNA binding protein
MNARTRLSAKGQVVIPAGVRKRQRLSPGRMFDVVETPEGILLKPQGEGEGISAQEAIERIKRAIRYEGPTATVEEMDEAVATMWAKGGPKSL